MFAVLYCSIDATHDTSGICKYVNDSPNSNSKMTNYCRKWPMLSLYATMEIPCGEEIPYDYGDNLEDMWRRKVFLI